MTYYNSGELADANMFITDLQAFVDDMVQEGYDYLSFDVVVNNADHSRLAFSINDENQVVLDA